MWVTQHWQRPPSLEAHIGLRLAQFSVYSLPSRQKHFYIILILIFSNGLVLDFLQTTAHLRSPGASSSAQPELQLNCWSYLSRPETVSCHRDSPAASNTLCMPSLSRGTNSFCPVKLKSKIKYTILLGLKATPFDRYVDHVQLQ